MGWLKSAVKKAEDWGSGAVHTVETGVTKEANLVVGGVKSGVDAAGQAFETVGTTVGNVAVTGADEVASGMTTAANTVSRGASQEFDNAVNAGQAAFDEVKSTIEEALNAGEAAIIGPQAQHFVAGLKSEINALKSAFKSIESEMSDDIAAIRSAATSKNITTEAEAAFKRIAHALGNELGAFAAKSYVSFGIEFGGSISAGVGAEVALGIVAGLPNITDVAGYGSVGVTVGADGGAEADIALVLNFNAPEDSAGGSLNVVLSLEVDVGGTVVVSFNVPGFTIGGISVGLGAGEEAGIAVGAGYTFVF